MFTLVKPLLRIYLKKMKQSMKSCICEDIHHIIIYKKMKIVKCPQTEE